MQKCTSLGYALHAIGELIGFLGLLCLLGITGVLVYQAVTGSFGATSWWLLAIPFAVGIISEIMVRIAWMLAWRRGFEYDSMSRQASWIENGQRLYYQYKGQDHGASH